MLVARRLVALPAPAWLRIGGYWYPRGGIPIDVFWQTGTPPDGAWIPDPGRGAVSRAGLTGDSAAIANRDCRPLP